MVPFLKGKVAWVTGGASGMGQQIALGLAKQGCDVAIGSLLGDASLSSEAGELVYKPHENDLMSTAKRIEDLGVRCFAKNLDVTCNASVQDFFNDCNELLGPIDILVNAAGVTAEQSIEDHSEELWLRVMDVNSNGPFRTSRLCLPAMKKRQFGRVINIASTAAAVGAPTSAAYCASKAAVLGLTRCTALEGAEHGVTANSISPGWVETNFGKSWMGYIAETAEDSTESKYIENVKADNPQKRMIQPAEIANLAVFLCRPESMGITMQDLTVSAGSLW